MAKAHELVDLILDGELRSTLQAWRAQDPPMSFDKIAIELEGLTGKPTSRETVRRWCWEMGIEGGEE